MADNYRPYAFAGNLYNRSDRSSSTVLGHCWARSRSEAEGQARESLRTQWPDSELTSELLIREIGNAVYQDTVKDTVPESELHWLDRDISMKSM